MKIQPLAGFGAPLAGILSGEGLALNVFHYLLHVSIAVRLLQLSQCAGTLLVRLSLGQQGGVSLHQPRAGHIGHAVSAGAELVIRPLGNLFTLALLAVLLLSPLRIHAFVQCHL